MSVVKQTDCLGFRGALVGQLNILILLYILLYPKDGGKFNVTILANFQESFLSTEITELERMVKELKRGISMLNSKLVRLLKQRDRNAHKIQENFNVLTALLQARSQKRRKSMHTICLKNLMEWHLCVFLKEEKSILNGRSHFTFAFS